MIMDIRMNRKRYARLSIISIDVFTEMYMDIANASGTPPSMAHNILTNTTYKRLTQPEKENMKTLLTNDGYRKCDHGLLYKILRHILKQAKQGWGNRPSEHDISTSDDVERIRMTRNKIFHRVKVEITKDEEKYLLHEIKSFAKRLDKSYTKKDQNGYVSKINRISMQYIDSDLEDKYVALGLENDELKLKLKSFMHLPSDIITVRLYSGKKMKIYLAEAIPEEEAPPNCLQRMYNYYKEIWEAWRGTSKEPQKITIAVKIVGFRVSEAEEIVSYLQNHRLEINDGSKNVILKSAEIGSIELLIELISVQNEGLVFSSVISFLERIFVCTNFQSCVRSIDVLLFPGVQEGLDCSDEECRHSMFDDGDAINLELTVPASRNDDVYEATLNFVDHVMEKTNHIHNIFTEDKESKAKAITIPKRKKCIDVLLEVPMTTRERENLKKQKEIEKRRKQREIEKRRKQRDAELNEDVNCWKTIRNHTIPRLLYLRKELIKSNNKIQTVRTIRNVTAGASILTGICLAPFTRGASLGPAAALTSGTAGLMFLIEIYIEKTVLETTQSGIDMDIDITLRLRRRVTAFRRKGATPFAEELFTVDLNTIISLGEDPILSFIKSWVGTESASLLNAIKQVGKYTENLKSELEKVEKLQEKYSVYRMT